MPVITLIFAILFAIFCYFVGAAKGYSGVGCAIAGFFGGLIATIILFILPDKQEAAERESAQREEIQHLKDRIAQLEAAQSKDEVPTETE